MSDYMLKHRFIFAVNTFYSIVSLSTEISIKVSFFIWFYEATNLQSYTVLDESERLLHTLAINESALTPLAAAQVVCQRKL